MAVERFTVALAQLNSDLADNAANLGRASGYIAKAAEQGADLVMFPELYLQGYRADEKFAATAEPIPGPTTERLLAEARRHDLYIVMGMARADEGFPHLVYNSLCLVGPDGIVEYFDKIHLGTFHPYREGVYFAPGQRTPVFDTRLGRLSLQICYDAFFPELTRAYACQGSVVNLVISAGPGAFQESWRTMLQARSIENAMPSVYCNVVGAQKDFSFFGGSMIVDATGVVTAEAKIDEEDFIVGTVDVAQALRLRRQTLLYRDRRPDLYGALTATAAAQTSDAVTRESAQEAGATQTIGIAAE